MKKVFYFVIALLLLVTIFSCQRYKKYTCQCETINALYNPDAGVKTINNVNAKNKEDAKMNCEGMSESWGSVTTTCKLQ